MEKLVRLRKDKKITPEELVLLVELSLEVPSFSPDTSALSELEELLPGSPDVLVLRANLQYHEGQVEQAIEILRAVMKERKENRRKTQTWHRALAATL